MIVWWYISFLFFSFFPLQQKNDHLMCYAYIHQLNVKTCRLIVFTRLMNIYSGYCSSKCSVIRLTKRTKKRQFQWSSHFSSIRRQEIFQLIKMFASTKCFGFYFHKLRFCSFLSFEMMNLKNTIMNWITNNRIGRKNTNLLRKV